MAKASIIGLLLLAGCGGQQVQSEPELWLFLGVHIHDANDQQFVKDVIDRAAAAGYTHILIPFVEYEKPSNDDWYPAWGYEETCRHAKEHGMRVVIAALKVHETAPQLPIPLRGLEEPYGGDKPGSEYKSHLCLSCDAQWPLHAEVLAMIERWLEPDAYLLPHEEIRLAGWCSRCRERRLPDLLAEHINGCAALCPANKPVYVWSDMLDETHNAADNRLYWNRASFRGASALVNRRIGIINWCAASRNYSQVRVDANNRPDPNGLGRCERSLAQFAWEGRRQIVSAQPENTEELAQAIRISLRLNAIQGVMYLVWTYKDGYPPGAIEDFAAWVRQVWKEQQR